MYFKNLWAAILLVGLGACAEAEKPLTAEQVSALPADELCWGYVGYGLIDKPEARLSKAAIRAELTRRGLIDAREWQAVDRQTIARGMNRCEVLAIYGKPLETNNTADMEIVAFAHIPYVMFQNGVVVNFMKAAN